MNPLKVTLLQTIFEATFKTKSLAVQVMKEKRGCHDTLVAEEKVRPLSSVDETTVSKAIVGGTAGCDILTF